MNMIRASWLALSAILSLAPLHAVSAQDEPATTTDSTELVGPPQITITDKWSVLVNPG